MVKDEKKNEKPAEQAAAPEAKGKETKTERLARLLREAQAEEQRKLQAKRTAFEGQLASAKEQKAKIEERIAVIEKNIEALGITDEAVTAATDAVISDAENEGAAA